MSELDELVAAVNGQTAAIQHLVRLSSDRRETDGGATGPVLDGGVPRGGGLHDAPALQRIFDELHDLRLEVTATRALLERRGRLRAVPFIESADDLPGAS
jgi:hypothetical protein